jgi:hypothetical protein
MRIPGYHQDKRRSLNTLVRWLVRLVVWPGLGLLVLVVLLVRQVLVNDPFTGLHNGRHWVNWTQLSPEARDYTELRWERPYAELAWSAVYHRRELIDHFLILGFSITYRSTLTPQQTRTLLMNNRTTLSEESRAILAHPLPGRMTLEDLLRCTWNADREIERLTSHLVKEDKMTEHRRDELLFLFCDGIPPYIKAPKGIQRERYY